MNNNEVYSDSSSIAEQLIKIGFSGLFQAHDEKILEKLWNEPGMHKTLETLVTDTQISFLARFLAAEILFHKQKSTALQKLKNHFASIYAVALAENFTGTANPWGLPGFFDGLTGQHFISLGNAAIPELLKLLDHENRVYYAGSKEATTGNNFKYRIKDLAAFYLSRIKHIPLQMDVDPFKRDKEISRLRMRLK